MSACGSKACNFVAVSISTGWVFASVATVMVVRVRSFLVWFSLTFLLGQLWANHVEESSLLPKLLLAVMAYLNDLRWINIMGSENDKQKNSELIKCTLSCRQIPKATFLVFDLTYTDIWGFSLVIVHLVNSVQFPNYMIYSSYINFALKTNFDSRLLVQ